MLDFQARKCFFLRIIKVVEINFSEHRLDGIQAIFEQLEIFEVHAHEVGLGHGVENSCLKRILLDNLVKEDKWVFILGERSILINHQLVQVVSVGIKFLFERAAPRDSILLLFLDVLVWHLGRIVEKSGETMHHCLAESTGTDAFGYIDTLFDEHLAAVCHARGEVKVFLRLLIFLAHLELLFLGLEILEARASERIHRHFSLSTAHANPQLLRLVID